MPIEPVVCKTDEGDIVTFRTHDKGIIMGLRSHDSSSSFKEFKIAWDDWERLVDIIKALTKPSEKTRFLT
jgi:hypothetical protein